MGARTFALENPKTTISRTFSLDNQVDLAEDKRQEGAKNVIALMDAARKYGKWPIDPELLT